MRFTLFSKAAAVPPSLAALFLAGLLGACGEDPAVSQAPAHAARNASCQPVDCVYAAITAEGGEGELAAVPGCGCVPEEGAEDLAGPLTIYPQHLERMSFAENGLATVYVGRRVAYVERRGRTAWTLRVDNGPDEFVEGLARAVEGWKVGFVDLRLETVIEPRWDFAFPFDDGLAVVCDGCREQPSCPTCEHSEIVGGEWGYIDRQGEIIVEPMFSREDLPEREVIAVGE